MISSFKYQILSLGSCVALAACAKATPVKAVTTTATTALRCAGMKVAYFAGAENDAFSEILVNGANAAASDLGLTAQIVYSDWDGPTMDTQFQNLLTTDVAGIAVLGNAGTPVIPSIATAVKQGILVTSQNGQILDANKAPVDPQFAAQGYGYVGAQLTDAGVALAQGIMTRYASTLTPGSEVCDLGNSDPTQSNYARTQGILATLSADPYDLHVDVVQISTAVAADASSGLSDFASIVTTYPSMKLLVTDSGALTGAVKSYFVGSSPAIAPGAFFVAGFDLSAATGQLIEEGYVNLVLDQQPFLQGYLPLLQLCLSKTYGFGGLSINTSAGLVDNTNIAALLPLVAQGVR